jgi:hypothetical protein
MLGPLHVYLNGVEILVKVYHPLFELAWKNLVQQQKSHLAIKPRPETAEFLCSVMFEAWLLLRDQVLAYTETRRRPLQLVCQVQLLETDLPAVILFYRHYFQPDNLRGYSRALSYVWQLCYRVHRHN